MLGSLIGGLFGLAGSAMNAANQYGVNAQNQKYTQENMKLQNKLNKDEKSFQDALNRQYQDFLWNNQYSKAAGGMKAAGLNPADNGTSIGGMSASNNVSAGPSGPSAHGSMADLAMPIAQGAQLGLEAQRQKMEGQLMGAQQDYYNALADKTRAETTGVGYDNDQKKRFLENNGVEAGIAEVLARTNLTKEQQLETAEKTNLWIAQAGVAEENKKLIIQQTANAKEELNKIRAEIGSIAYDNALKKVQAWLCLKNGEEAEARRLLAEAQTDTENQTRDGKIVSIQLSNTEQKIANTMLDWHAGVLHYVDQKKYGKNMQRKSTLDSYNPLSGMASSGGVAAGGAGTLIKALK